MRRAAVLLALGLGLAAPHARAEELVLVLSTQDVAISSNFTGARLALFGAIERDAATIARSGRYEIAVTVSGPSGGMVVRTKEQFGPLWVNRTQRRYQGVPGFFALLTTGPVADIASEETRQRRRLGLAHYFPALPVAGEGRDAEDQARQAVLRLRQQSRLYVEDARGVTMPRPNLFAAYVSLPASAPTGRYSVAVNLLSDGITLKTSETSFVVRKIGFEAFLAASARDFGLLYGLAAAFAAVLFGYLGNLIFRKD